MRRSVLAAVAALALAPAAFSEHQMPSEKAVASAAAAVRELGAKFASYPAAKLLEELSATASKSTKAFDAFLLKALVRENPIVNAHEIAYVTRAQYAPDHHNTEDRNRARDRAGGVGAHRARSGSRLRRTAHRVLHAQGQDG